jgi:hypothetical protein
MPQVNKTFTSKFNGASVSPDGQVVSANVTWTDAAADTKAPVAVPRSISAISIRNGKVFVNNQPIADAPAELVSAAASLASKTSALVDSLISAGKISPQ